MPVRLFIFLFLFAFSLSCLGQKIYTDNRDSSIVKFFNTATADPLVVENTIQGPIDIVFTLNDDGTINNIEDPYPGIFLPFTSVIKRVKESSGRWDISDAHKGQRLRLTFLYQPYYADSNKTFSEAAIERNKASGVGLRKANALLSGPDIKTLALIKIPYELEPLKFRVHPIKYYADERIKNAVRALQNKGIDSIFIYNSSCAGCEIINPPNTECYMSVRIIWQNERKEYSQKIYCDGRTTEPVEISSMAYKFFKANLEQLTDMSQLNDQAFVYASSPIHYTIEYFSLVTGDKWSTTYLYNYQKEKTEWQKFTWIKPVIKLSELMNESE